jgi:hypothetical protein
MTDAEVEMEGGLERLDVEFIYELLRQTHWARNRPRDVFERAIKHIASPSHGTSIRSARRSAPGSATGLPGSKVRAPVLGSIVKIRMPPPAPPVRE